MVSREMNLYRPRGLALYSKELIDVAKNLALTFFILIAILYLLKTLEFSRLAFFYFLVISFLGLASARPVSRKALKALRGR